MALLESCLCCSLLVASCIAGVYSLVAYVVAFTIELWWILEAEVALPAPAYLLCAGYFFVFILSALLLHGLTVKRTLYLLGWLFTVIIFSFPEAGLVLFMSLHYWQVRSLYGLTELVYWACRVLCNIAGIVCIQSLYSTWKEEKLVMRRLQVLNMTPVISAPGSTRSGGPGNGYLKNGSVPIGYQNAGFVNSMTRLNVLGAASAPIMAKLRRSASSASQISMGPVHMFGGSLPAANFKNQVPQLTPLNNLQYAYFGAPDSSTTGSEFNASSFDGMLAASVGTNLHNSGRVINTRTNLVGISINRTQSLVDLREDKKLDDSWSTEVPSRPVSVNYMDYIPTNVTQSLDRRFLRFSGRLRRASSMDELNRYRRSSRPFAGEGMGASGIIFQAPPEYYMYRRQMPHSNGSKRSLAESDDAQKIRDVAL